VPLRPVSELGLVDLTDLASRDAGETATRRPPTRARSTRSQSPRRGPNKDRRREQTVDQSERRPASTTGRGQARARSSKRLGGSASESSGRPQSRAAVTPRNVPSTRAPRTNGATRQKSSGASTRKRRKRSGSGSRPEGNGPRRSASSTAGIRRGVSPDRRRRPGSQRELKRDPFKTQSALANAQPRAPKLGISVVTGAMGLAGGLLLSRAALRR
jgi:hypothetical protein